MNPEEITQRFTYHPPFGDQVARYGWLRNGAREFALQISNLTPVSREQSLAITSLEECVSWANKAIARNEKRPEPTPITEIAIDVKKLMDETNLRIRLADFAKTLLDNTPDHELCLEHLQLKREASDQAPTSQPEIIINQWITRACGHQECIQLKPAESIKDIQRVITEALEACHQMCSGCQPKWWDSSPTTEHQAPMGNLVFDHSVPTDDQI